MFSWLASLFPASRERQRVRRLEAKQQVLLDRLATVLKAKYDAAQTTDENRKHWANADALSATAANDLETRKKLRERARYEVANNSYAKGIVRTLANNLVGSGPRLQVNTPDPELNRAVEHAFAVWAEATRLPDQLRTMKQAKVTDGESFAILRTNSSLPTSVKLDLALIECDQVTDPTFFGTDDTAVDGIHFDQDGNPYSYDVLRYHPGDNTYTSLTGEYDTFAARRVLHWFRCDRPGQVRGIPELTPALPLYAMLRRFMLATLTAAETAAMFAAMLESTAAPDTGENPPTAPGDDGFETLEIARGMMTRLPEGWKMSQLKSEHPAQSCEMFVKVILREISRCLNVPWHMAAGDYSDSNYATARLGSQEFRLDTKVERQDCEREVLDPTLSAWLDEAVMIPGLLPPTIGAFVASLPHIWHWPAWDYIDPLTEAQADTERLTNGTSTLAAVCAARGEDWQEIIRQQVREKQFRQQEQAKLGITSPSPSADSVPTAAAAVKAAARSRLLRFTATEQINLKAAGEKPAPRRFSMIAYTGIPMAIQGFSYPIIVDLAGLTGWDKSRPILRDHRDWKIIGHTETISLDGSTLTVDGVISGTGPDAKEVLNTADNAFPWQASIGCEVDTTKLQFIADGQSVAVNGQTFPGPVYVSRSTKLKEVSFVPLGADDNTAAYVAATGGTAMTFEQWAMGIFTMEEFAALSDDAKSALQKVYDIETAGDAPDPNAPPPDMPTGAAAPDAAVPTPAAATAAATPNLQANVLSLRELQAAESERVAAIHALTHMNPGQQIEVVVGGQKTKVPLQAHAIRQGWTAQRVELELLREERKMPTPHIHVAAGKPQMTPQVLEAALCRTRGIRDIEKQYPAQVLEAADKHYRHMGLQQLILIAASAGGYHAGPGERINKGNFSNIMRHAANANLQAAFSTVSLPGILGNVANKDLLMGYMDNEEETWREISAIKSVSNFQIQTSYRMLDSFEYEEVGPAGEIKHGSIDQESYTRQAKTYAKMFALTRRDIINDDLGAFDDLRNRLGRGAKRKFENLFWANFLANHATFFTTARTNYLTGATTTLLTDAVGLGLAQSAWRAMRTPSTDGSKRIGRGGRAPILLVPPELEIAAETLFANQNLGTVANSSANIFAGKYRVVVEPRLSDSSFTGYSTTAWYLVRDPSDLPAMIVSFLNGQQAPTVESEDAEFNTLGMLFRGYHDFGVDQAEYLAALKVKGAA